MKKLGKLSRLALALLVGAPALARAQIPAVPGVPAAAVPAGAVPAGAVPATGAAAVPVAAAPQRNLFSFFCPTDAQLAKWKACFCGSQFGQFMNNSMAIPSVFSGGILPQCCPLIDPAGLLLPPDSALGAAAQVQKDTVEAAKRCAAIRYISTADCNWWPEVQAALANSLRMDRNECVRLCAAKALQRGCCCNPVTVRALVQALSPLPTDGNPPEDSPRVRAAAMIALDHCLCCYYGLAAAPPCPAPAPAPVPEELPKPRKEGPSPEVPPAPAPLPPGKVPVVTGEPPLRPISATRPARDPGMEQLIQEARLVLQKAKERQEAALRAAAAQPQSLTELLEETFHSPAAKTVPLAAGQQKTTPPPTIFGPPVRTQVMEKPSPAPTVGVVGAPKGNPPLAPVAANSAPPTLTPVPVAPAIPFAVPPSAAPTPAASASEMRKEAVHPSATQTAPLAVGQQKTTPPTIFSPPARTQVVVKPSPAPTAGMAGAPRSVIAPPTAPKANPSLAPVAANSASPDLTPVPVAPVVPSVVPPSASPTPPVSMSPAPLPVVPSVVPSSATPTPPASASEMRKEVVHPSATQTAPLAVGQQKTTPPTIFSPPARTQVVVKPSPAPTAGMAGAPRSVIAPATAPKGNPSLAPVAANSASPDLTPPPVAPVVPPVVPSSAKTVSGAKTQPEKAPVLVQQTAATPALRQTNSAWQLLLLLRNSSHDDVRAHAASSLADHDKPTPAVVQALVSSAGADASSEVRLACLKTLLKLRVNDPALPSTLMRLQTDQDARVRDAAKALHQQLQSRANAATPPRS